MELIMPVAPQVYDFTWVRGSTSPLVLRFKQNNVAIPFDDVRVSVYNSMGRTLAFRVSIATGEVIHSDIPNGEVTFTPTSVQTRSLTESELGDTGKNEYEVEVRNGASSEVYLCGTIAAVGGLNDD
jgi:hypothetical protein